MLFVVCMINSCYSECELHNINVYLHISVAKDLEASFIFIEALYIKSWQIITTVILLFFFNKYNILILFDGFIFVRI